MDSLVLLGVTSEQRECLVRSLAASPRGRYRNTADDEFHRSLLSFANSQDLRNTACGALPLRTRRRRRFVPVLRQFMTSEQWLKWLKARGRRKTHFARVVRISFGLVAVLAIAAGSLVSGIWTYYPEVLLGVTDRWRIGLITLAILVAAVASVLSVFPIPWQKAKGR